MKRYFFDEEKKELIVIEGQTIRSIPQILPEETTAGTTTELQHPKKFVVEKKKKEEEAKRKYQKKNEDGPTKTEIILDKYRNGMTNANEIAKEVGCPVGSVYTALSKARRSGEIDSGSEKKTAVDDFGIGKEVIKLILSAKRDTEMSDEQIAEEYEITVSQLRVLYLRYRKDPEFKTN